jgi:glycosyltransferase involved in cell wall biosynthesis
MNDTTDITLPRVSVIVPVYNDSEHIELLLDSLSDQDYPKDLLEIIIVDNNSTDNSRQITRQFASRAVTLLEENKVQSSYAARNRGIREAKGQILVFIDSDCVADRQWLTRGVKKLLEEHADLVGGQVKFTFSKKQTAAEYYDSLCNFQFEEKIKRGTCGGGNLFVRKEVFDTLGLFDGTVKSGGDVQWTRKATESGCSLIYAPEAVVYHPARMIGELLKKLYRVSIGMGQILISKQSSKTLILSAVIGKLKPYRISFVKQLIAKKGVEQMNNKLIRIWIVTVLCRSLMALGLARTLFRKAKRTNQLTP